MRFSMGCYGVLALALAACSPSSNDTTLERVMLERNKAHAGTSAPTEQDEHPKMPVRADPTAP